METSCTQTVTGTVAGLFLLCSTLFSSVGGKRDVIVCMVEDSH